MIVLLQLIEHFKKIDDLQTLYFAVSDIYEKIENMDDFVEGLNYEYGIELNMKQIKRLRETIDKNNWESVFRIQGELC